MSTKLPTLSVVVPNYNHGKYLPACLNAILTQSVTPHEIIVVDDGSTDNSVEVIEDFVRRYPMIKFLRNEKNSGVLFTCNRGADLATGDFITLPGADDELMPGFIEKSLTLLAQYPQAGLSGTICQFRDMTSGLTWNLGVDIADKPCYLPPERMIELARQSKLHIFTSTMILRRDAFLQVGKYIPELKWHSDWFAFYSIGFRYGACFIPEVLGEFRVFHTGYSKKGMRKTSNQLAVLRGIMERLETEEFKDVADRIRRAAYIAPFGKEMLWVLLTNRRYWKYMTFCYLKVALWWIIRAEAKKILPDWAAKLYFKMAGYNRVPKVEKT